MKFFVLALSALLTQPLFALMPDVIECTGAEFNVTYNYSSENNGASLMIHKLDEAEIEPSTTTNFTTLTTPLGSLLSVVSEVVADSHTDWLSVVMPEINMMDVNKPVPFGTRVIYSRRNTSIGGESLVDGLITQALGVYTVACTASKKSSEPTNDDETPEA